MRCELAVARSQAIQLWAANRALDTSKTDEENRILKSKGVVDFLAWLEDDSDEEEEEDSDDEDEESD